MQGDAAKLAACFVMRQVPQELALHVELPMYANVLGIGIDIARLEQKHVQELAHRHCARLFLCFCRLKQLNFCFYTNKRMNPEKATKYMQLARYQADLFSKDPSTKVAAIILDPRTHAILSTGYNGIPRKMNDTLPERWERPAKYLWTVHAECNAVCNAARSGMSVDGAVAVVTLFPCSDCAKMLIQAGIKTIVAPTPDYDLPRWGESFKLSNKMFKEVGIEMVLLPPMPPMHAVHAP